MPGSVNKNCAPRQDGPRCHGRPYHPAFHSSAKNPCRQSVKEIACGERMGSEVSKRKAAENRRSIDLRRVGNY